jgi:hypothetical protein
MQPLPGESALDVEREAPRAEEWWIEDQDEGSC